VDFCLLFKKNYVIITLVLLFKGLKVFFITQNNLYHNFNNFNSFLGNKNNMSDIDLENFRLQLAQVEAALAMDPNNSQLMKLKEDLEKVITVSSELLELSCKTAWKVGEVCQAVYSIDGSYKIRL
jgi:hypothetical protein